MKALLQRVQQASVTVDGVVKGKIGQGLVVFVGFKDDDDEATIATLAKKVALSRVFDDASGVMNESVVDQQLEILSISQFTLYGDTKKGHRPSYSKAAKAEVAVQFYERFNQELQAYCHVETGVFGADMKVQLINDGPVTILLEMD
jgi:D-tyrosyl-tRNA(Tyr) deacylase